GESINNGYIWLITAVDPWSQAMAGSIDVTLSDVPTVIAPPALSPLPELPLPEQPASAIANETKPATATSRRAPDLDLDVIIRLSLLFDARRVIPGHLTFRMASTTVPKSLARPTALHPVQTD